MHCPLPKSLVQAFFSLQKQVYYLQEMKCRQAREGKKMVKCVSGCCVPSVSHVRDLVLCLCSVRVYSACKLLSVWIYRIFLLLGGGIFSSKTFFFKISIHFPKEPLLLDKYLIRLSTSHIWIQGFFARFSASTPFFFYAGFGPAFKLSHPFNVLSHSFLFFFISPYQLLLSIKPSMILNLDCQTTIFWKNHN